MRTWIGYFGVALTGLLIVIVYAVMQQSERTPEELTFQDGGIVGSDTGTAEYTLWRPNDERLEKKNSFGDTWEQGIITDKTTAKKTLPKIADSDGDTRILQKTPRQETKTEYVNVGDMWKSNKKIELTAWNTPKEEDAATKAVRAFGNAVGAKIQMLTLAHGKQSEKLGLFTQTRSDASRAYIDTLAGDYDLLAKNIEAVDGPSVFSGDQKALASGYRGIADGLRILKRSTDDASTYENMLTYNTTVEGFATSFISFALLFKEQGVTFSENEPGGIFTPPVSQQ